jgi:hypothetical protein
MAVLDRRLVAAGTCRRERHARDPERQRAQDTSADRAPPVADQ